MSSKKTQEEEQKEQQQQQQHPLGFGGSFIMTTLVPPLYISWRIFWANRMPIMDCDEVYNYWEPLYFLLNNRYNDDGDDGGVMNVVRGQQTWEYANEYALRTYAYIYPMKWVAQFVVIPFSSSFLSFFARSSSQWSFLWLLLWDNSNIVSESVSSSYSSATSTTTTRTMSNLFADNNNDDNSSIGHFLLLRAFLAACMAICEMIWLYTLSQKVSPRHALWTGVLMLSGAGMNHSAAAYLPSSTWTMAYLLCSSCFLHEWNYTFCFVAVMSTLAIGWPFGVVLLIPMGLFILLFSPSQDHSYHQIQRVLLLLLWTAFITASIQAAVMYIDAQEYGRWTLATMNIFTYNAAGGGDELYGVEPASYYVKNLLLNWNIVAPLAICVMPCLVLLLLGIQQQQQQRGDWKNLTIPILLAPLVLWLCITVPRPHKEERFLFPIYPILCLGAVWAVDTSIGFLDYLFTTLSQRKQLKATIRMLLHGMFWTVAATVSLSRTMALAKYYSAPLSIYTQLAIRTNNDNNDPNDLAVSNQGETNIPWMVCTCGEWYRFPSSFFLPKNTQLGFLKSSFTGQLPQPFSEFGSRPESGDVLQPFNNQNLEQPERYVNLEDCRWVIDLEESGCIPHDDSSKIIIAQAPFLDAAGTSTVHRILYIPFWHERAMESGKVHYHNYLLAEFVMNEK